jgi:hypothetical protein
MSESGKKWLLWGSVIALLFSVTEVIYSIFSGSQINDIYGYIGVPLLFLSGLNLITLFSLKYSERKWLRNIARFSLYALILTLIAGYLLNDYINTFPFNTPIKIFLIVLFFTLVFLSCLFTPIYIFLLKEAGEIKDVLVLLLLIVISLVLVRIFFYNTDIGEYLFGAFMALTILTGCGIYMYGVRCLLKVEKNRYLKIVSYLACLFIAFGSIVFAAIMSSEGVYALELIYFIPAILLTLTVLLSLPISGYVNWTSLHKKILKKIMISWLFFFLIFSVRFIFPEYFKIFEYKADQPSYQFDMKDYELQNKNGLKPE